MPKALRDSSLEYKFIDKHKDLLAEPVKLSGKENSESEDTKTETAEENGDGENGASQSNASLLKSQRKKMRLMSLMELLNEFINSKASK